MGQDIKIEPLFPTGSYLNARIGWSKTIPDTATKEEVIGCLLDMWEVVTEAHRRKYPNLYNSAGEPLYEGYKGDEMRGTQVRDIEPEDKIQSWKTVISMCTSITALERFKPAVDREKNEELTQAYNDKLKNLQNG